MKSPFPGITPVAGSANIWIGMSARMMNRNRITKEWIRAWNTWSSQPENRQVTRGEHRWENIWGYIVTSWVSLLLPTRESSGCHPTSHRSHRERMQFRSHKQYYSRESASHSFMLGGCLVYRWRVGSDCTQRSGFVGRDQLWEKEVVSWQEYKN